MKLKHDAPEPCWRCMNSGGQPYWLMPIPGWMFACMKVAARRYRHTFIHMLHQQTILDTHGWKCEDMQQAGMRIQRRYIVLGWVDGGQLRSSSVVSWWFRRTLGSLEADPPCQGIAARNLPPTPASRGSSSAFLGSPLSSGGSTCPGWFDTGPTSPPGPCLVQQWILTVAAAPVDAGPCPSQESQARRGLEIRWPWPRSLGGTPGSLVRACRWCPARSGSSRRLSRAEALSESAPPSAQPRLGSARTAMGEC